VTPCLDLAEGAVFQGHCDMGSRQEEAADVETAVGLVAQLQSR